MSDFGEHPAEQHLEPQPGGQGELARRSTPFQSGLPSGTGLGKYRILERIRTYHNAVVYKARDLMLDRLVALKQMLPELMDSPTACGNFKKEAQLLARIPKDARHVLNVHELIEDEMGLFIVEEYIHGDWLEALIGKRRIGVNQAFRLLKTAALGLKDLHAHHVVHRDINPGNILITRGALAKIANFSSAAHEGDFGWPPVVTPKYSAPELLRGQNYDDRVDLYSLGMVLFEVVVGRIRFHDYFKPIVQSPMPISGWTRWQANLKRRLPDASMLNPNVPPALASILRQMTAKRLEERYTCIEEVLAAIARHTRAAPKHHVSPRLISPWDVAPTTQAPQPQTRAYQPTPAFDDLFASTQRLQSRTRTQSVRPAASRVAPGMRTGPMHPYPLHGTATPRKHPDFRVPRSPHPAIRMPVMPAPILPRSTKKPVRRKRHPVLKQTLAVILLISVGAVGYVAIDHYTKYVPPHPIQDVILHGFSAFDKDDLPAARKYFTEAANMTVTHAEHQRIRTEADNWLIMVSAKEALDRDDFAKAQQLIRDIERRGGVSPTKVDGLQQILWNKQDAYKIAAEGYDRMKKGDFSNVELRLDDYQRSATAAGLDPDALKNKLTDNRTRFKYQQHLTAAEEALAREEFDKAFTACYAAEGILVTSDTRDLRKRIGDAQKRMECVARGDSSMLNEEFTDAISAYEEANRIRATVDVEQKARTARAHLLLAEAKDALARGDLLAGEDSLNSSIWNHPLYEAKLKLEKMQPAFAAAREARKGDRAVDLEDYGEAIRIYESVLANLPDAAAQRIKAKINEARRRDFVSKGQKAYKREDWPTVIELLESAQRIAFDPQVEQMLITAKAKIP